MYLKRGIIGLLAILSLCAQIEARSHGRAEVEEDDVSKKNTNTGGLVAPLRAEEITGHVPDKPHRSPRRANYAGRPFHGNEFAPHGGGGSPGHGYYGNGGSYGSTGLYPNLESYGNIGVNANTPSYGNSGIHRIPGGNTGIVNHGNSGSYGHPESFGGYNTVSPSAGSYGRPGFSGGYNATPGNTGSYGSPGYHGGYNATQGNYGNHGRPANLGGYNQNQRIYRK
ncbi:glycine-rich cell wall structural protein 2-like isoform X2 [Diprion similis]|uniref:glycine-rich cell wall structural protein 2-like isoform X2 n=1 Tax=Diprion similis TaxID=362088 RepID=UPI001EF83465|nr:glycine-rich cell wall structural protein 2-like isoform X2 [Diprion similis]